VGVVDVIVSGCGGVGALKGVRWVCLWSSIGYVYGPRLGEFEVDRRVAVFEKVL
jgi:hypothetical protein